MNIQKLKSTIKYSEEHEIPYEIPPTYEEIVRKINQIIDYLNAKPLKIKRGKNI